MFNPNNSCTLTPILGVVGIYHMAPSHVVQIFWVYFQRHHHPIAASLVHFQHLSLFLFIWLCLVYFLCLLSLKSFAEFINPKIRKRTLFIDGHIPVIGVLEYWHVVNVHMIWCSTVIIIGHR